jgi:Aspartyl protease
MNDEDYARSEQLAFDMQLAHDLQEREHAERNRQQQPTIVRGRNTSSRSPRRREATGTEMDGSFVGSFNAENMLYVPCEVEGRLVEMLVDSGASSSAISKKEMIRLNLQSKLNTRYCGKAVGCGAANVLGVVENVQVSIGHVEFRLFFLVLDTENPLLILGLDQMRKFKCLIDLEENKLIFGGKGGVEVQFLPSGNEDLVSNYEAVQRMRQNGECRLM